MKKYILFFLLLVLISGCAPAPTPPVSPSLLLPTITYTIFPTLMPSATPVPLETPVPTTTPFPPLADTGPYLMLAQGYSAQSLLIYDKDGHGRRILNLPDGCFVKSWALKTAISPDGKWLVCYMGSFEGLNTRENLPITLYIVNITDGTFRKVVDVATEGYQDKLKNIASKLEKKFPEYYKPRDGIAWTYGALLMAFWSNIFSHAWSPDNRQLAFAAQIDGDSPDVYTFDLETGAIRWVEDSLRSVANIQWSPAGEYIVFKNALLDMNYSPTSFHVVKAGGLVVKEPKELASFWFGDVIDWLSPTMLLITDGTDTAGLTNLITINISTGEEKNIWGGFYGEVAVDHENQLIALTASEFTQEQDWGMHFITFDGTKKKIADGWYYNLFFRGGDQARFSVLRDSKPESQVGIFLNGSISELNWHKGNISISPEYSWVLIYGKQGAHLYNKNDELVRSFDATDIDEVIWWPDSLGFFYSAWDSVSYIAYVSMPSGEPVIVDRCLTEFCRFDFDIDAAWLP